MGMKLIQNNLNKLDKNKVAWFIDVCSSLNDKNEFTIKYVCYIRDRVSLDDGDWLINKDCIFYHIGALLSYIKKVVKVYGKDV